MMKISTTLINTLLLLLSCQVMAQDSTYFTVEEAKLYATEHHLDIQNSLNDLKIAQQQVIETRGIGLPQIDISGQFNHFINIPVSVVDATLFNPMAQEGDLMEFRMGTEYSTTGTLQVNQLLFNGSYIVGLQVSKFYTNFQETSADLTEEKILFNVLQAYQLASIAKENLAFADSMVILAGEMVEKQNHFFELGLILQEDMDQLSFTYLTTKNIQVSAEIQYENALNLLKFSMGYQMSSPINIIDTPTELMAAHELKAGDINTNLQLSLLQKKVKLSSYNVKNNKYANLPSLYAFYSHSYNAFRNEFNFFADEKWYPQTVWGLQLQIPVFSGWQRHARSQQAKIALMKDQNSVEQLENALQFQETQLQNNLRGAYDKLDLQEQNIVLAKSIYEKSLTKESLGEGNSITVTQKHNQLMMAHAQYLEAKMELLNIQLDLDKLYNKIVQR